MPIVCWLSSTYFYFEGPPNLTPHRVLKILDTPLNGFTCIHEYPNEEATVFTSNMTASDCYSIQNPIVLRKVMHFNYLHHIKMKTASTLKLKLTCISDEENFFIFN